jgi:oxalate decarboxylase
MDSISRRRMLAVTAAGGLLTTTTIVNAQTGPFQSKPGDGGVARAATGLPPGEKVAYHNPKDVADMPDFHFSLDASRPTVTSGGWAKEATVHQFPISKGLAGVHMFLDPGALRELHWHAIAAEWAYVIDGRCQTVVLDLLGASEINNYGPGDLWFFPKGHGHSIQTIGAVRGCTSSQATALTAPAAELCPYARRIAPRPRAVPTGHPGGH